MRPAPHCCGHVSNGTLLTGTALLIAGGAGTRSDAPAAAATPHVAASRLEPGYPIAPVEISGGPEFSEARASG